jgi:hypothetical protein
MSIVNKNVYGSDYGYKMWEYKAGDYECSEQVIVMRADWWSALGNNGDNMLNITVNVIPADCSAQPACAYTEKYINDAICDCIAVDTLPAAENLYVLGDMMPYQNHEIWL